MVWQIGRRFMGERVACSISVEKGQLVRCWIAGGVVLVCAALGCEAREARKAAHNEEGVARPLLEAPTPSIPKLSQEQSQLRLARCTPCRFEPTAGLSFELTFTSVNQAVERLELKRVVAAAPSGGTAQSFNLQDVWSPSGEFLLQAVDINFDGILDLAFGPVMGTPNLELDYWLVEPAVGEGEPPAQTAVPLRAVGRFSNLTLKPETRELETFEKGGHGGLLFKRDYYRWVDARLERIRSVEQTEGTAGQDYRRTTRQFAAGKLVAESSETIQAP
jgi:hypothetical protein